MKLHLAIVAFALLVTGCEGTKKAVIALEERGRMSAATTQVDFYREKATVFEGANFKPFVRGQRHRLEKVGPDRYAMTEAFTGSTSAARAKKIAELGMAMYAKQTGYGFVAYESVKIRVICASGSFKIPPHPIAFARARYSLKSGGDFQSVDSILAEAAPYQKDASREEKIASQLHWADQCTIINTRDPSALAPTDYHFSLSTKPPPDFKF